MQPYHKIYSGVFTSSKNNSIYLNCYSMDTIVKEMKDWNYREEGILKIFELDEINGEKKVKKEILVLNDLFLNEYESLPLDL